MHADQSLKAFLTALASDAATRGSERLAAFTAAAAAALMAAGARQALEGTSALQSLAADLEAARGRIMEVLESGVWQASGPPTQQEHESLMALAEQSALLVDLGARVLEQAPAKSPEIMASLGTAVPMARAAVDGAVQTVLATVGGLEDRLAQTALKTRANGLAQKARRAEADFARAMIL